MPQDSRVANWAGAHGAGRPAGMLAAAPFLHQGFLPHGA